MRMLALCVLLLLGTAVHADASISRLPQKAVIASAHKDATAAGHEVLAAGGNAFDAAVAVSAALAVVEPASSGVGGGAFWTLRRASDGHARMVDARETSPREITRAMFLDAEGGLDRRKSLNTPLAAGIPGQPAGLAHIAANWGRLPLSASLAPAIRLAREGFEVDDKYRALMRHRIDVIRKSPTAASLFLVDGELPEPGHRIIQTDLADTLERIASEGRDGFYEGAFAEKLVAGVRAAGGVWTIEDLKAYRVVEREPITFNYRGFQVLTAPPPSSGGVALAGIFQILDGFDLESMDATTRTHVMVESMRRAYRDRTLYLGDPDFVDMPMEMLLSPHYAAGLRASIRLDRATPSSTLPGLDGGPKGSDTTHFSLIDREGNLVAGTLSVNLPYGCGYMVEGTGFLLNNEMDDFALRPGTPNAYGLIGEEANAPAPGKRMLSSMTPTLVLGKDRVAVIGTPGGSRIITMIALALQDFVDGVAVHRFVAEPRFHHQYLPDVISTEPGAFEPEVVRALQALGHTVSTGEAPWGNMQAVTWDLRNGEVAGGDDPRWESGKAEAR